jgi:hypothetical protein
MSFAVTTYLFAQALHIMAVVVAYGLPMAYPLLLPYLRRKHPRAMPGAHDVQHRLNVRLAGPGTALIIVAGVYMASKHDLWGEPWVAVPIAIIAVIAVVGGAFIVPVSRRMASLARADVEAAPAGGAVTWSGEYDRTFGRYIAVEVFLGVLVLVAIFFMTAKPFA